ncbi:penicillin-binding protein [Candidatus Gottesmanbacteria bacterium]|nr:penicillin-binding protein [Candidatus Gottesmanbacteria bacterium]
MSGPKISSLVKYFKRSRSKWRRWLPYTFWVLPLAMIVSSYILIFKDLPSPSKLGQYDVPLATKIYDRNGKPLFDIFAEQNRTPVSLTDIPLYLRQATISIEDKNFYQHGGVNPIGGMLRAMAATLTGGKLQGGSTITQQLVKSALLTPQRTIIRKVKEIILAFWVELLYPKNKILELYLNEVPYGGTAWGVETAAEKYFGKSVKELTLGEAALLAGLPQAPSLYSPFGAHPELAKVRQQEVLKRMVEDGYITQKEADAAGKQELHYKQEVGIKAPHFVMYVKELLEEKYGQALVERGGLKVTTTLDLDLQDYAQATVAGEVTKLQNYHVTNGAALITKPATGEILAMVGSTDYFASPSGNFNVTTALRQPGSSIKPINYAIGLEKHIVTPATMFLDEPTCFTNTIGKPPYCPVNYDGKFHGPVQLRMALGNSFNVPAVKMLYLNTVTDMVASASAFGLTTIQDPSQYGLSLTLGGGEVHMTDMAAAFGVFANGGIRHDLVSILKVADKTGRTLEEYKDPNLGKDTPSQLLMTGPRVISRETSFLISHILLDNNARQQEFGPASELYIPNRAVSVKTGTTDDLRDNWTIGFTPQILVATWVGNNDNSPMNPYLVSGITGAAPIWHKLIVKALEGKPDVWPQQPDDIVSAQICAISGLLPPNPDASDKGCPTRTEYFIKGTIPAERENLKQSIILDKDTGDIVEANKPNANVEVSEHQVVKDALGTPWCLDCRHDENKPILIK